MALNIVADRANRGPQRYLATVQDVVGMLIGGGCSLLLTGLPDFPVMWVINWES
ncbi:MAG: hypothetical protein ACNYPE_18115 [Candidatus Azotimanducaceae bacterium WSBS_2022_MAG_OTU7]